jgi:hypothetical protein
MSANGRRIAVISDVHGNIDALKAVFRDIRSQGVTDIVCLGDIVGYGAAPAECVRLIGASCQIVVMGNHEAMAGFDDVIYLEEMPDRVRMPIELARSQLSALEMGWLQQFAPRAGTSFALGGPFVLRPAVGLSLSGRGGRRHATSQGATDGHFLSRTLACAGDLGGAGEYGEGVLAEDERRPALQ